MLLRRLGSFILEITQIIVFAISIFLFLYLLILQPHKIKGSSMEPNFHNSEYLLTDKISYRLGQPQRGDVIVFKAPPDFKDEFIKRIIGLPNEKITVKEGQVFINDQLLNEPYLPQETKTLAAKAIPEDTSVLIPADSYMVFGDNRNHSFDSRSFGPISNNKITGKAWFIYWPPAQAGTVKAQDY
jgi:signal peptidase I